MGIHNTTYIAINSCLYVMEKECCLCSKVLLPLARSQEKKEFYSNIHKNEKAIMRDLLSVTVEEIDALN